jgi:polyhydroxybutyrate depolymerase
VQSASSMMGYSGFNTIAESNNFIAVYANGLNSTWNITAGQTGPDDVGFLNALMDSIINDYSVNQNRMYCCGFSYGGFMSHRMACEYSNKFAAIASVSGLMANATYTACNPMNAIPVLQIHGTADLIISYNGSASNKSVNDVMTFWQQKNACNATPTVTSLPDVVSEGSTVNKNDYSPCGSNKPVELLKIVNGGHTWANELSLSGIGNVNKDISASQEIWNFFNRFSLANVGVLSISNTINNISIYPNPVINQFEINVDKNIVSQIQICNLIGQQQTSNYRVLSTENNKFRIDASKLKSGFYYISLMDVKGNSRSIKFVKSNE